MIGLNKVFRFLGLFLVALVIVFLVWLFIPTGSGERAVTPLRAADIQKQYDVVVVGGDPEGVAAAVAAARGGSSTLLLDTRPVLGGLMTQGWLNSLDMNYGPKDELLNQGIFEEFFQQLEGDSFDVLTAADAFHRMVSAEENLDVWPAVSATLPIVNGRALPLQSPGQSVISAEGAAQYPVYQSEKRLAAQQGSRLEGVRVFLKGGQARDIAAKRIIDATQDGDIAAASGVPFTYGQEDYGNKQQVMAVTLVFKLDGISKADWVRMMANLNFKRMKAVLANNYGVERYTGANLHSAWGFDAIMQGFQSQTPQVSIRGLNVGRQRDGSVLINALQVFGIDGLKQEDRQRAQQLAKQELPHMVEYIRHHIPGFADARLAATAPELYVRETRHIEGLYRLTVDDVLENRDFPDRIAFGSYPIDIQATDQHFKGNVMGVPTAYAIPFRSLVPKGVENLLVVGRAASFDSLAHGSARVIPIGMATGQAAGVAATLSLEKNVGFSALAGDVTSTKELQQRLTEQGVVLKPYQISPPPETKHWAYEGMKFMRHYGLAAGGYNNNYRLDENMSEAQFINGLNVLRLAGIQVERPALYPEGNELTLQDTAYMFTQYLGLNYSKQKAYTYLEVKGFWNPTVVEKVKQNQGVVSVGAGYMLLKDFTHWSKQQVEKE